MADRDPAGDQAHAAVVEVMAMATAPMSDVEVTDWHIDADQDQLVIKARGWVEINHWDPQFNRDVETSASARLDLEWLEEPPATAAEVQAIAEGVGEWDLSEPYEPDDDRSC
jgi:hypothetical protein